MTLMNLNEPLYDWDGAAAYTHVSVKRLKTCHRTGCGPSYIKPSPRILMFRQRDLDDWVNSWERVETGQPRVDNS